MMNIHTRINRTRPTPPCYTQAIHIHSRYKLAGSVGSSDEDLQRMDTCRLSHINDIKTSFFSLKTDRYMYVMDSCWS
jgi:hypothetical protein